MNETDKTLNPLSQHQFEDTTILIVDDDPELREMLKSVLEDENYRTLQVSNGVEALKQMESHEPDLIISDLSMPEMDGHQLLQKIKDDTRWKNIPFIVITGHIEPEKRLEALQLGAEYLLKPFNHQELVLRVKNMVKRHKQEKLLLRLNKELQTEVNKQLESIIKAERLAFYFPQKLVRWIISSEKGDEITSEKKLMTIFFSDLSGFTEMMERWQPEVVQQILNQYFTSMLEIIERFDGTLDKFIGDGIMVFFGAPEEMEPKEQAIHAVSMAVAMQKKMKELTAQWAKEGVSNSIQVRMGIHQDMVLVGNFGSNQLKEYTVIGSGVNLANRLESYCEPKKILVSAPILKHTLGMFPYEETFSQQFRGFERLVPVAALDPEKD